MRQYGQYHENDCIIAIDIGGSKLMVGIVDKQGNVISKDKELLEKDTNEDKVMELILKMVNILKSKNSSMNIKGVGVAIPGLADTEKGLWIYSCFSGIRNYSIGHLLSLKLELPVFIDNDVNACAYGEKIYGVCKEDDDFLWVTISNGVGGGIVINGDIYRGPFMNAGEIGHVIVEENDPALCPCKNKGCLEAYASGPAILRRYLEKAVISNGFNAPSSAKDVAELAKKGDPIAIEVFKKTGFYLGKAIAHAVNILNPKKVVLGGGVTLSSELFIDILQDTVDKWSYSEANPHLIIAKTASGSEAALVGAAAIAERGLRNKDYA